MVHLTTTELLKEAAERLDCDPPPFAMALCGEAVTRKELSSASERADCPVCLDLLEDESAESDGPIATWRAAAAVLGVSEDTVGRRRRARDPERQCYFRDEEELVAWWRTVDGPPTAPRRRSSAKRRGRRRSEDADGPVDWGKLAAELTDGSSDDSR